MALKPAVLFSISMRDPKRNRLLHIDGVETAVVVQVRPAAFLSNMYRDQA